MKTVSDLTGTILGALKDEEGGRVALYHYLKNFAQPSDVITPELINAFYNDAFLSLHWQEKRHELHADIIDLLQRFFTHAGQAFRLDLVLDAGKAQIINVEQVEHLFQIVKSFEQTLQGAGDSLKILPETPTRVVAIKRLPQGEIQVRTYTNNVRVQGNILIPVNCDQELFYDAGLELLANRTQKLRPTQHSQVRFEVSVDGMHAQFISGYAFRQSQVLRAPSVNGEPRIFYPLKRLERLYVNRPSDPFYMELIGTLDRALQMLHTRSEGAQAFALQAFDGGQIAFDQIFPDDKALYVRLKELARWISHSPARALQEVEI